MSKKIIINFIKKSTNLTNFVEKVADWFFSFLWIETSGNIIVQRGGGKLRITVPPTQQSDINNEDIEFTGAFALSYDGDDVIVGANRATGDSTVGHITIGTTTNEFSAIEEIEISEDCWIYYEFVTDTETYTLKASATYPTQDDDTLLFVLGYAEYSSGVTGVRSLYPYSDIHDPARFI